MARRFLLPFRRCLALATCAAAMVAGACPGGALASPISTTFGTQVIGATSDGSLAPASLTMGAAAGVNVVRWGFSSPNADNTIKFLAGKGDTVLPVLGLPCDTSGCPATWSPSPSEAAQKMGVLISQFAARYGANGSFWTGNADAQYHPGGALYHPVQEFEIGNEENLFLEWVVDGTHLHWAPQSHTTPDTAGPIAYAQVYQAARTALHNVDPTGIALMGGLADSAKLNVDVQSDERYINALTPGTVDAVGYHDWVFDVSTSSMSTADFTALVEQDPANLRAWMETHGYAGVPISVTEMDACDQTSGTSVDSFCAVNHTSEQWGAVAADFVNWASCTPGMNINNIEAYFWGDTPSTASNGWLALLDSTGTPTAYGQDFLAATQALSTGGCPGSSVAKPAETTAPSISGTFAAGQTITGSNGDWTGSPSLNDQWVRCDANGANCDSTGDTGLSYPLTTADVGSRMQLLVTAINGGGVASASSALSPVITATTPTTPPGTTPPPAGSAKKSTKLSMKVRIIKVVRAGQRITLTIHHLAKSGTLSANATEIVKKHHKARHRRLKGHRRNATTTTFTARLPLGRWVISVTGKPAKGYATPTASRRTVRVTRVATKARTRSR